MASGLGATRRSGTTEMRLGTHPNCAFEECSVLFIPFPSYQLGASARPGAVRGARSARRSEPLTARIDLELFEARERGF